MSDAPPGNPADRDPLHPGTSGIWTFLFIDMAVFGLLFLVYLSERNRLPEIYRLGQAQLTPLAGLAGTLLLLTSSWAVASAIHALRADQRKAATFRLTLGIVLGLGFVANKLWEYHLKIEHGIGPLSSGFFTFYFLITGLHLVHLTVGLGLIAKCRQRLAAEAGELSFQKLLENVGLFWHFVDILWLFIFPMLYLAGAR